MKKIVLCFLLSICLAACGEKQKQEVVSEKPVVKIGVIGPFSGNNAALGQNCRQGVEFAISEIKNPQFDYQLIFEDDGFQAAKAATAANKLIEIDKVDVLFTCSAVSGGAAAPIAAAKKKFIFTVIASEKNIAKQSQYSFLHWPAPLQEGQKVMEILEDKKADSIVLMVENHPGARALADGVIEAAAQKGMRLKEYTFMSSERNFTDIVLKANENKADMWVLLTLQPGINIIIKRMKALGINTPYTSCEIPTFMEDKSLFEDVPFVDVYDGAPEMLKRYSDKYHTQNYYGVAYAYDGIMIINKLFEKLYNENKRVATSLELAQSLLEMEHHNGAVGVVEVDDDGVLQSQSVIKTVKNGKVKILKE